MTQKVGLITYIKIKAKALLKKVVGPLSASVNNTATIKQTSYGNNSIHIVSGGKTVVNGKVYKSIDGDVYIKDGIELKPGTPEYEKFKKEMDDFEVDMKDFEKEMSQLGRDLGKMGMEMGVTAREAAENIRRNFR